MMMQSYTKRFAYLKISRSLFFKKILDAPYFPLLFILSCFCVSLVLSSFCPIWAQISTTAQSQTSKPADSVASSAKTLAGVVSLQNTFEQAYQNNKELIAAKYNISIAKAGIQIAAAIPNPQFSFLYGFGPAFAVILAGNPQQFGLEETLQTAGKRTKQINLARANYSLAELQVAAVLFDIHNRARRAYAELAAAEAYAQLIKAQKQIAYELSDITEKRYQAGNCPQSEVLQTQLGVIQFDTQLNQAEARLEKASAALALLTGQTPSQIEIIDVDDNGMFKLSAQHSDLVPSPDKPLPVLEQLLPIAYKERPDVKIAIQQAFVDRRALTLAKTQRIPNLAVDCGYQFTTFKTKQPYNLFPGNVPNSPGCYLNLSAEAPIFYQYQGEVRQAKETWLQDYDQLEQTKAQVANDIVTAYESVLVSKANIVTFQRQLIPAATQVAKLARRRYEVGKGDLASAILAKQQYQQILSSYFDAVVSYQNAWADLEKAMGVPLQL